ncbi:MAG TPA: hypothetical protein VKB41_05085 [Steroidobacteraceae bacterium]|nr:hypothetical protein [Steroidobacteraceae bacterium]
MKKEQPHTADVPPPPIAAVPKIEVLAPDQYNELGDGDYTVTAAGYAQGLWRDDGTASQPTDVLSLQPDGTWQTRPAGTAGNFERCKKTAAGAVYRPIGSDGKTWLVGMATETPNT